MAKTMTGIVASDKGNKTIVVKIVSHKTHPIYKKSYMVTNRIMAHDEANEAKPGDKVVIVETRPISAKKRFRLEKIVERAAIEHREEETPAILETEEKADKAPKPTVKKTTGKAKAKAEDK